jgi:hypothetical protein
METWLGVITEQWREGGYVIDFKVGQTFGEPHDYFLDAFDHGRLFPFAADPNCNSKILSRHRSGKRSTIISNHKSGNRRQEKN